MKKALEGLGGKHGCISQALWTQVPALPVLNCDPLAGQVNQPLEALVNTLSKQEKQSFLPHRLVVNVTQDHVTSKVHTEPGT